MAINPAVHLLVRLLYSFLYSLLFGSRGGRVFGAAFWPRGGSARLGFTAAGEFCPGILTEGAVCAVFSGWTVAFDGAVGDLSVADFGAGAGVGTVVGVGVGAVFFSAERFAKGEALLAGLNLVA